MLPDLVETNLRAYDCFSFLLPASALGIESDIIMEVSVEYGHSKDGTHLIANAWARERNATVKGFISTIHTPLSQNEPRAIFEELNKSDEFMTNLAKFESLLEKQR